MLAKVNAGFSEIIVGLANAKRKTTGCIGIRIEVGANLSFAGHRAEVISQTERSASAQRGSGSVERFLIREVQPGFFRIEITRLGKEVVPGLEG